MPLEPSPHPGPSSHDAAVLCERAAELLTLQRASAQRAGEWRTAATALRVFAGSLAEVLDEGGAAGLEAALGVSPGVAASLREWAVTGRLRGLERLEGLVSPEDLFTTVPGMATALAHAAHQRLGVETLEELEVCAKDGRLARVPGFGPRRVRVVSAALTALLDASGRRRRKDGPRPPVPVLLEVDRAYRAGSEKGALHRIAPRRFNPAREAWLPILHLEQDGWLFSAMYSNTRRAHDLGRTRDWVVIYFEQGHLEGQCTVLTDARGPTTGRRVIRGREGDCRAHYARAAEQRPPVPAIPPSLPLVASGA